MSAGPLRLACATFQRVFDVHPAQDALTLAELTEALTRFIVKPKLKERIDHEVALVDAAVAVMATPGASASGKLAAALDKARRDAVAKGKDPGEAVRDKAEHLRADARRAAKRDMRLWAPLLFKPGGERDEADIEHVSCLVLDYDGGTPIDEASAAWRPYYHVVHTTWSHTPARPKLRLVLPLAAPIRPEDFRALFAWAEARTHFAVDPTGRGVSRAHAMPVTPSEDAPRQAIVAPGELLDPVTLGIVAAPSPVPVPPPEALVPCLLRADPEVWTVTADARDPWDPLDDDALWGGGAPTTQAQPRSARRRR
ncbi:MAG: hypothetical protein KC635_13955, partial [Myxococcales bacterium]|nr:hypothetical protein [Myxococcales bacterium]